MLRGANYTLVGDHLVFGQFDGDAANLMDARFWSSGKWYTIPGVADSLTDGVPGISLAGGYTAVTASVTPPPNGDIYQPLRAQWVISGP